VASRHARAINELPGAELVAICDVDVERARAMARDFKIPHVGQSLAELAPARPEVVHILTPPASHCALTLEALAMGCHVFVEKPMADTVEECSRMMEEAKGRGLVLS